MTTRPGFFSDCLILIERKRAAVQLLDGAGWRGWSRGRFVPGVAAAHELADVPGDRSLYLVRMTTRDLDSMIALVPPAAIEILSHRDPYAAVTLALGVDWYMQLRTARDVFTGLEPAAVAKLREFWPATAPAWDNSGDRLPDKARGVRFAGFGERWTDTDEP